MESDVHSVVVSRNTSINGYTVPLPFSYIGGDKSGDKSELRCFENSRQNRLSFNGGQYSVGLLIICKDRFKIKELIDAERNFWFKIEALANWKQRERAPVIVR